MGPALCIAIYLTVWWMVFLMILPIGVISHAEAGIDRGDGTDPASPVDPKLKKKFITTSWVSAIVFAVIWLVVHFHLIVLPPLAMGGYS
jgi:predicted secreted protein